MDGLVILIICFIFCYLKKDDYVSNINIPTKLNPYFYEDDDAFMIMYHELIK